MENIPLGLLTVFLASLLQGTFALFLKYAKPLKWENFWLIYSITGVFLAPLLFALMVIPNFFQVLNAAITQTNLIPPLFFGALWGIGSVLFGISASRIGLSLTYTIILGLTTFLGTILPLFINRTLPAKNPLIFLIIGLIFILAGIITSGYSGYLRNKSSQVVKGGIILGLFLAFISGLFSPLLNIAFITAKNIAVIAQNFGASPANSTAITWVIILSGGFVVNSLYAIYLLAKNDSLTLYRKINFKILLASAAAGVFWYGSVALYGLATVKLGKLGASVGWGIFISLSIVISNLWAVKNGEWQGSKKAFSYQIKSIALIIIGIAAIAASTLS